MKYLHSPVHPAVKNLLFLSIALSLPVFVGCVGIAIIRSNSVALEIKGTRLLVQAKELELAAEKLREKEQAQKLIAEYRELAKKSKAVQSLEPRITELESGLNQEETKELESAIEQTVADINDNLTEN